MSRKVSMWALALMLVGTVVIWAVCLSAETARNLVEKTETAAAVIKRAMESSLVSLKGNAEAIASRGETVSALSHSSFFVVEVPTGKILFSSPCKGLRGVSISDIMVGASRILEMGDKAVVSGKPFALVEDRYVYDPETIRVMKSPVVELLYPCGDGRSFVLATMPIIRLSCVNCVVREEHRNIAFALFEGGRRLILCNPLWEKVGKYVDVEGVMRKDKLVIRLPGFLACSAHFTFLGKEYSLIGAVDLVGLLTSGRALKELGLVGLVVIIFGGWLLWIVGSTEGRIVARLKALEAENSSLRTALAEETEAVKNALRTLVDEKRKVMEVSDAWKSAISYLSRPIREEDVQRFLEEIAKLAVSTIPKAVCSAVFRAEGDENLLLVAGYGVEGSLAGKIRVPKRCVLWADSKPTGGGERGILLAEPACAEVMSKVIPWSECVNLEVLSSRIMVGKNLWGAISVYGIGNNLFSETDENVLNLLAKCAGIGIRSGQFIGRIGKLARTDRLTGLLNRGFFSRRLLQGAEAAKERGERFCIIFIDIDDFRKINMEKGYRIGDEILAAIAKIIKDVAPEGALLSRFGGDEFAIALFGEDALHVDAVVEELRRQVEKSGGLSISVGRACWPTDGFDCEEVLKVANERMLQEKLRKKQKN